MTRETREELGFLGLAKRLQELSSIKERRDAIENLKNECGKKNRNGEYVYPESVRAIADLMHAMEFYEGQKPLTMLPMINGFYNQLVDFVSKKKEADSHLEQLANQTATRVSNLATSAYNYFAGTKHELQSSYRPPNIDKCLSHFNKECRKVMDEHYKNAATQPTYFNFIKDKLNAACKALGFNPQFTLDSTAAFRSFKDKMEALKSVDSKQTKEDEKLLSKDHDEININGPKM